MYREQILGVDASKSKEIDSATYGLTPEEQALSDKYNSKK